MRNNFTAPNIKYLCQKHGISPRALAAGIGMDPSTIYRLTDDKNPRTPHLKTLRNIADFFGTDPHHLASTNIAEHYRNIPSCISRTHRSTKPLSAPVEQNKLIPLVQITNPADFFPEIACLWSTDFNDPHRGDRPFFGFKIEKWIHPLCGLSAPNLIAMRVTSNSMAPVLKRGDTAFISGFDDPAFASTKNNLDENIIVAGKVSIGDKYSIVFRKTVKDENGDILLAAENPAWPKEELSLAFLFGKVVGVSRQL